MPQNKKGGMILPRTPDKGGDPKSPTYHDWQAREMIAEKKAERNKKHPWVTKKR